MNEYYKVIFLFETIDFIKSNEIPLSIFDLLKPAFYRLKLKIRYNFATLRVIITTEFLEIYNIFCF